MSLIEPQELHFTGLFTLINEEISGELIYRKSDGVILLDLGKKLERESPFGKSYGNLKYITGKLNTGDCITLFNNHCVDNHPFVFSHQKIKYVSDYLICSKTFQKDKKYNKLVFRLENALLWSNFKGIVNEHDEGFREKEEAQDVKMHWFGAEITFLLTVKNGLLNFPAEEEAIVEQRLEVHIEFQEQKTVEELISVRDKIISFISFGIQNNVNILDQYLINFQDTYVAGNSTPLYRKHLLIGNNKRLEIYPVYIFEYNFTLSQISPEKDISDTLEKLQPVLNLYLSLYKYRDMPIEMIFLNLAQALETFHARFFYDDQKRKFVESVKSRFETFSSYDLIRNKLLTEKQLKANHILLVSRLNDLFIDDDSPVFEKYWNNSYDYAQKITDTRNYYTHYGKDKELKALKDEELGEAIFIMRALLEYHICKLLGIQISQKIGRKMQNFYSMRSISEQQSEDVKINI